jgi:serine phosphatase RsbU (regulator of sigma subunit)
MASESLRYLLEGRRPEFEEGRVGVVVGEATGKGMPAALVVSATSNMLRAVAQALCSSSPGEILA